MLILDLTEDQLDAVFDSIEENKTKYMFEDEDWLEEYLINMGYQLKQIAVGKFEPITDTADKESSTDLDNAILLYESLKDVITPATATGGGFWTSMAHANMKYMSFRWPITDDSENRIKERYLMKWTSSRRERERNGLSRLWWGVHLTIVEKNDDPYLLTRELFSNQDVLSQVLDRDAFSPTVTRAFMRFMISERESGNKLNRNAWRSVMKYIFTLENSVVLFSFDEDTLQKKLHDYYKWYRRLHNHLVDDT